MYEQKLNQEKEEKAAKKDKNEPEGPVIKKNKEQLAEEMRLKKALRAKNSQKIKKIWANESLSLFPKNFESSPNHELSTKFTIASQMLDVLWESLEEKIIIVSNYCETLDIMESICLEKKWPSMRFDGKTKIAERQNLVDSFNEDNTKVKRNFVLLLSAKAGGCGLNLMGCNRMMLLDPDWNPSNDA